MKHTYKISKELEPVLTQLINEGYTIYTYEQGCKDGEINSLYWYENGRMLNIQPSSWEKALYKDGVHRVYNLSVSYYPSQSHGSGCQLSPSDDMGTRAEVILNYRKEPTWVSGVANYPSLEKWLERQTVLTWFEVTNENL